MNLIIFIFTGIFSGSVDNKSIVWDLEKGNLEEKKDWVAVFDCCLACFPGEMFQYFSDHSGYVQGVTWDPLSRILVSQSADRYLNSKFQFIKF